MNGAVVVTVSGGQHTFAGPAGVFRQTSTPSPEVRRLHTALDITLPPRILDLDPEQPATR